MPIPKTAVVLQGGCHCGAIRYKIDVPEYSKRPQVPSRGEDEKDKAEAMHFPIYSTCSCNDCRAVTAGLFMTGVNGTADMVSVSCLSRTSEVVRKREESPFDGKTFPSHSPAKQREANGQLSGRTRDVDEAAATRPPYLPGMDMLLPGPESEDTFVGFYHSSNYRTRSFCQRCGTPISANIWPTVMGLPDAINIIAGSLDREDLELIGEPEIQVFWDSGVGWINELISGCKAPKYRGWQIEENERVK